MTTSTRLTALGLVALAASALHAQATGPAATIAESKQAYNAIKNNLTRMAEAMPAENYDFKPSADIRSFGALMGHIADAQIRTCSAVNGQPKQSDSSSKTSKADLVAVLKEAFAECDKAWEDTTDANAFNMISAGRGQRSRLGVLIGTTVTHNNEEYGYGALYLRLKGVVPPSSAGRGGR
jgi:uncharacterized damage-inducible protein DinB